MVYYTSPTFGRAAATGSYTVVKLLPSEGDDYQYRIKSSGEAFERVAKESQLDKTERVIPKKPAPDLIRAGYRFSGNIMRTQKSRVSPLTRRDFISAIDYDARGELPCGRSACRSTSPRAATPGTPSRA